MFNKLRGQIMTKLRLHVLTLTALLTFTFPHDSISNFKDYHGSIYTTCNNLCAFIAQ